MKRSIEITMPPKKTAPALFIALLLLVFAKTFAQSSEKPVKMKDLPKPVRETVMAQSKGATIKGLAKETENGKTYYEVELKVDGHVKDVLIDSTGALVEIEEEIAFESLPRAVRAGIETHAGRGRIVMVESITRNDTIVAYEAHIKAGRKFLEIKVGPDGQLIKE